MTAPRHMIIHSLNAVHRLPGLAFTLGTLSPNQSIIVVVVAAVVAIALILLLAALVRVLRTMRRLHEASSEGRRVSGLQVGGHPVTSFDREGKPSDPLNVKLVGTSGQVASAFVAAGWYRADEIDFVTSVRISYDSVFNRKYSTAPVSNLYLFGRKEDYAFERPGNSVRNRDHVRLWNTATPDANGRPIWVGGATHDIAVEISPVTHLPTHKIASAVDDERESLLDSIVETGWVIEEAWEASFGEPTVQRNSLGDTYHTDGRRAIMTLAEVAVFAPVVKQVRGAWGARLSKAGASLLRWRLPQVGRDRADKRRQLRLAREQAATHATPPAQQ